MAGQPPQSNGTEPRGFGEHSRGLAGEYAHEQGWGLKLEQRSKLSGRPQNTDGGLDYDYGARNFGDEPINTELDPDTAGPLQNAAANPGKNEE